MNTDFRTPLSALNPTIFRAYDIRGLVPTELTEQQVYWLGRAIADQTRALNAAPVCVGADGRLSGPLLKQALIAGLREGGADVLDSGYVPTPVVYFAAYQQPAANAVMLTASHNPPDQNGLKILINGQALMDDEIQALAERTLSEALSTGAGQLIEHNQLASYLHTLIQKVPVTRRFKLVVDGGNGIAGPAALRLFERLKQRVVPLFTEVDGRFPNHSPDPCLPQNLAALKQRVLAERADLGIAFDGDGDRVVLIDETGQTLSADDLLMLFAQQTLALKPGATVLYDVKCSSRVKTLVEATGGRAIMARTGHSPMKRLMHESGAQLGGELSAHYYFADWHGFDDGLFAAARFLSLMAQTDKTAAELRQSLPVSAATPELRIKVAEAHKAELIERLRSTDFGEQARSEIDGLRLEFDQGWALIRASNTEPALILRFEASTPEQLTTLYNRVHEQLRGVDSSLSLPELDAAWLT